jgi:hypothetical protein
MTSGPVQLATHLWGTEGVWRRGEHLHATMTSGPVQLATHSISVEGGNQEAIKRQSRGNQEAIKRQSEVISDPLDLGASRRREQRVQVRQLLTQQHLWGSRRAVVSACMQGRACKTGALTRQHLGRSHQRHSSCHQRSSARSHLGRSHQRHSSCHQSSSARSHLEVLEPPLAAGEPLGAR